MQFRKGQSKTTRDKKFPHSVIGTKITESNKQMKKTREEKLIEHARVGRQLKQK